MTLPPLMQSPLRIEGLHPYLKVIVLALLFVLFAGGILAVWLMLPSGAVWRRKRREQRNISRALRSMRWR